MLNYLKAVPWFLLKVIVTLGGLWTIQTVIHEEGYFIPLRHLIICAIVIIVCLKFWILSGDK